MGLAPGGVAEPPRSCSSLVREAREAGVVEDAGILEASWAPARASRWCAWGQDYDGAEARLWWEGSGGGVGGEAEQHDSAPGPGCGARLDNGEHVYRNIRDVSGVLLNSSRVGHHCSGLAFAALIMKPLPRTAWSLGRHSPSCLPCSSTGWRGLDIPSELRVEDAQYRPCVTSWPSRV